MDIHFLINSVSLAPMAGAADSAFRRIAMEHGASFTVSEMISAKALCLGDKKTYQLMEHAGQEQPFCIQLFGYDPNDFLKAASLVEKNFHPDFIDINMGCPAPKITGTGAGSALMRTPELAADIVRAVKSAVSVPVTAKIRSGFSEETINAPKLAMLLEEAGIDAITVHGRSREQMYRPPVNLSVIRSVKEAVSVPVIGNGDIRSYEDVKKMKEITGCDGVMIGRGALGNPFLFSEIAAKQNGASYCYPNLRERLLVLHRQVGSMIENKGSHIAFLEARKHAAWYIKGFKGAAALREKASSLQNMQDLDTFIKLAVGYE